MAYQSGDLPTLFHALGDSTRMAVIEALCDGPQPVSHLARPFDMALPSFMKHLRVLEAAGMTTSHKKGRSRIVALRPERLTEAKHWLAQRHHLWSARFDALDAHLSLAKEPPK